MAEVDFESDVEGADSWGGDDGSDWGDLQEINGPNAMAPQISDIEVHHYQKENPLLDLYWKCGRCEGPKNHPSRAICMACGSPNMDNVMNIIISGSSRKCPKCKIDVAEDLFSFHVEWCQPLATDEDFSNWAVNLPDVCKNAIVCVHEKGKKHQKRDVEQLERNMKKIGYGHLDVAAVLSFFEWHVPIIIQLFPNELVHKLLQDPFYRNQFETGTSHGSTDLKQRRSWETRMFDGIYDKASASERVKYGCLNMSMDEKGCSAAYGYGDAYFRLNDSTCRWRTTVTSEDSSKKNCASGSLKYASPILKLLPDPELKALCECIEVFKCAKTKKSTFSYTCYREAQIHGTISLHRDVDEFHVPQKYRHMQDEIEQLCVAYSIRLIWF